MGRNTGLFNSLDAFGKTLDDVKIRTRTGALLTMLSLSIILSLVSLEFYDYRKVHVEPSILVDKSRGEKLTVDLNVTFPRVPCYLLSIDIMDISGEHQNDLTHDIEKTRISKEGDVIDLHGTNLKGELERVASVRGKDYCGSCYGGVPPPSGCCNTCEEVRESYVRKGWSFTDPDSIEQCIEEHWSEKITAQNTEGCNVAGRVHVNKVVGNFHMSPGKSFQANSQHVHDLVPYLRSGNHHDFGHVIHRFSFGAADDPREPTPKMLEVKKKLGIVNPLEGIKAHTEESNLMFQYFIKVVSTQYHSLMGEVMIPSHQYSVTSYERDLSKGNRPEKDGHGHMSVHGLGGTPGIFFNYEISPMLVIHRETRQSFAHFITSTMAIVGGVLTVFQLIDSMIFNGKKRLKGEKNEAEGYGSRNGKLM